MLSEHVVLIMGIIDIIKNTDDIRQERIIDGPVLKLNKRLK